MIVCVCKRVSDRKIRELRSEGVCSLEDLQARTGLGTQCGQCQMSACEILLESPPAVRPATTVPYVAVD